jgi:hypothetical protein
MISGQITVTTAGTAVAGPSTPTGAMFALKAHSDNADTVWVGNDGADDVTNANGFPLDPGEGIVVYTGRGRLGDGEFNLSGFYFDADSNGDKVCWIKLQS